MMREATSDRTKKAKKSTSASQRSRASGATAVHTQSSSRLASLSSELLLLVVQELKHKPTLAICMRVSSTLNRLVAPLLYRSIHITENDYGPKRHSFSALPSRGIPRSQRLSAPRSELLRYTDIVTIDWHYARLCHEVIAELPLEGRVTARYTGTSLRVNVMHDVDGPLLHDDPSNWYRSQFSMDRCGMFKYFVGKKLVIFDLYANEAFDCIPYTGHQVGTIVSVITHSSRNPQVSGATLSNVRTSLSMVWVIYKVPYHVNYDPLLWLTCIIDDIVQQLTSAIEIGSTAVHTVVTPGNEARTMFQGELAKSLTTIDKEEKMKSVNVITMSEYLSTSESDGVFSEEERESLLRDEV